RHAFSRKLIQNPAVVIRAIHIRIRPEQLNRDRILRNMPVRRCRGVADAALAVGGDERGGHVDVLRVAAGHAGGGKVGRRSATVYANPSRSTSRYSLATRTDRPNPQ